MYASIKNSSSSSLLKSLPFSFYIQDLLAQYEHFSSYWYRGWLCLFLILWAKWNQKDICQTNCKPSSFWHFGSPYKGWSLWSCSWPISKDSNVRLKLYQCSISLTDFILSIAVPLVLKITLIVLAIMVTLRFPFLLITQCFLTICMLFFAPNVSTAIISVSLVLWYVCSPGICRLVADSWNVDEKIYRSINLVTTRYDPWSSSIGWSLL